MKKTVAVTGASGFLGSNVCRVFSLAGWDVIGLRRPQSRVSHLVHLPVRWNSTLYQDDSELTKAVGGAYLIVHCAGSTVQSSSIEPELQSSNIDLTDRMLRVAARSGTRRFIHVSSTVTCGFSRPPAPPVTEISAALREPPWSDGYFETKRTAERRALDACATLDVVIVNPGFFLGPFDVKPTSGRIVQLALGGFARGWPIGCNSFVDVRDVAAGILQAAERGRSGERYILAGHNLSYRVLLMEISSAIGTSPPRFRLSPALLQSAGAIAEALGRLANRSLELNRSTANYASWDGTRYDSSKARLELSYQIRPIAETIRDTVTWFKTGF